MRRQLEWATGASGRAEGRSEVTTLQRAPGKVRFTVEDFDRMNQIGLFDGRRVELLDGELYEVTKNPPHDFAVGALADALSALLPRGVFHVREEKSIEPW